MNNTYLTSDLHGLKRAEWEKRFAAVFAKHGVTEQNIIEAELGAWPEEDADWTSETPEEAAESNLSYWSE